MPTLPAANMVTILESPSGARRGMGRGAESALPVREGPPPAAQQGAQGEFLGLRAQPVSPKGNVPSHRYSPQHGFGREAAACYVSGACAPAGCPGKSSGEGVGVLPPPSICTVIPAGRQTAASPARINLPARTQSRSGQSACFKTDGAVFDEKRRAIVAIEFDPVGFGHGQQINPVELPALLETTAVVPSPERENHSHKEAPITARSEQSIRPVCPRGEAGRAVTAPIGRQNLQAAFGVVEDDPISDSFGAVEEPSAPPKRPARRSGRAGEAFLTAEHDAGGGEQVGHRAVFVPYGGGHEVAFGRIAGRGVENMVISPAVPGKPFS